MKKAILLTAALLNVVFCTSAQVADLNIYKGGTNKLSYVFNNYVTQYTDSTGGPNTPYEGTSQYIFSYNSTGQTWGGQIYFRIDDYTAALDLTQYSHLVIAYKGTADINYNTLSVGFEDSQFHATSVIAIADNSTNTTYQLKIIPLADFNYTANSVGRNDIVSIKFAMCCSDAIGQWFLDDIYFTNTPPVTATFNKEATIDASISPNPSSGLYVVNSSEKIDAILVTDSFGNTVLKSENNNDTPQIDLTNYPDGLYFVTLSSNDKMITKKLVKNR